ncbi:MAG: BON domain-containing protein [Acidobacteria bacterium]|nr:BON domain-containing protein [Acidobacteriota bacterium]
MKNTKKTMILAGTLLAAAMMLPASSSSAAAPAKPMEEKIRKELVTLPFYNVFDNLAFQVNGDEVTLFGQVTRPTLKSSAENVVKRIEGVAHVNNKIEVLPLSPFDDRLRLALFRAIYSYPGLDRYALGAIPGIHIIVNNGNVRLEGVVAREMDKNIANLRANGVAGVFSVENNLRVASK